MRPAPRNFSIPHFRVPGTRKRKPCELCTIPSLRRDVSVILHPGGAGRHRVHVAERLTKAERFADGSHGDKLVEALEWSVEKAKGVCEKALSDGHSKIALEALRVISEIIANEAKLAGLMPRNKTTHLHLPPTSIEELRRLAQDVIATSMPTQEEIIDTPQIELCPTPTK